MYWFPKYKYKYLSTDPEILSKSCTLIQLPKYFPNSQNISKSREFIHIPEIYPNSEDYSKTQRYFKIPQVYSNPEDLSKSQRFIQIPKIYQNPEELSKTERYIYPNPKGQSAAPCLPSLRDPTLPFTSQPSAVNGWCF